MLALGGIRPRISFHLVSAVNSGSTIQYHFCTKSKALFVFSTILKMEREFFFKCRNYTGHPANLTIAIEKNPCNLSARAGGLAKAENKLAVS